jgi:murein L,D-transpeptidase YcbB/YkuD
MRALRCDRILAGTALALILAASAASGQAAPDTPAPFEAAVPMPTAPLPPPTISDVTPAPATTGTVTEPSQMAAPAPSAVPQTANIAPSETVAPDPLAALDPADRPIAEKMRDLLAAKVDKIFANKKERAAAEAFYQKRNLAPLWFEKGLASARAVAALAAVKASDAEGLDPRDYRLPAMEGASPDALADAELKLTALMIVFTRHLQAGRFPQNRIGHDIEMPQVPPEPADVLAKLADTTDVAKALAEYAPPHPGYQRLKAALAEMRGKSNGGAGQMADGPTLKLTKVLMEDPRVPMLRERLGLAGGDPSDLRFDARLVDAVKKFQRANELNVTGALDSQTVKELNGPPRDRQMDVIIANMERWRWLPRDLGKAHVMVNIPEYTLRVVKDGGLHWSTRIVVGKPNLQTPLLTASMKYITVNPTWNVPPSIVQKEYLPALAQDPTVLSRMGLKVEYDRDGSVHISQPPGERNALGRVRFNFPNRFLVYQHDTPDKNLFSHDARAYSHGCMRVQDPPKYAEVLLNLVRPTEGWNAEKIKRMYGTSEVDIQFPTHIPVHLTYQTASVDDGKLVIRKDIYNYDARMIAAIKSERGMIEMVQERPRENSGGGGGGVKRARLQPQQPAQSTSFFDSFFGGNRNAPQNPQNAQNAQTPQQRRIR